MKILLNVFLGLMVLISLSRCAYSKHCFGNGVCRVVENGQERYEGSPEEVAKYLKEQDAEKKHQAQLQQRYNEAPKRGESGKARVALFLPRGTNDELAKLSGKYYTMLKNALSGDARIELVDQGLAEPVLEDVTRPSFASSLSDQKRPLWSQDYVTALRNKGFFADVVVFTELSPKPLVGFLGDGKNGGGLVSVEAVEFRSRLTSIYQYQLHEFQTVGKSTNSLSAAGFDKKMKFSGGTMNLMRNVQDDEPAIQALAQQIKESVNKVVTPGLPTVASIEEIQGQRAVSAEALQSVEILKNLFK
jgi:hypothetical protein